MKLILECTRGTKIPGIPNNRDHICAVCHVRGIWGETWRWWGSVVEGEEGVPVLKTCSDACRARLEPIADRVYPRGAPAGRGLTMHGYTGPSIKEIEIDEPTTNGDST